MKTNIAEVSELSTTGAYTLLLFVSKQVTLQIGQLGTHTFKKGIYTYTGSAHGKGATNLKNRIARHTKKQKQKFWHIDYLLANQKVSITSAVAVESAKKLECKINSYLKNVPKAKIPVNGFGASDCKQNCKSHLLYFPELKTEQNLVQSLVSFLESLDDVLSITLLD